MEKKRRIVFIITLLWLAVIWGHSMVSAVESEQESLWVLEIVLALISSDITDFIVRKSAHFTEYFILGALVMQNIKYVFVRNLKPIIFKDLKDVSDKKYLMLVVPVNLCLVVAFIDETIQLFVEGRAGQIQDVWIDLSGAFVAIILTYVIINVRDKVKSKSKKR